VASSPPPYPSEVERAIHAIGLGLLLGLALTLLGRRHA
jgi:hypothetical protein